MVPALVIAFAATQHDLSGAAWLAAAVYVLGSTAWLVTIKLHDDKVLLNQIET